MEGPLQNVLDYIKTFFHPLHSRNRVESQRTATGLELPLRTKPRFSPYSIKSPQRVYTSYKPNSEGSWLPFQSQPRSPLQSRRPMKPLKFDETILLDDEDVQEKKSPSPKLGIGLGGKVKSFTSTPSCKPPSRNGNENGLNDIAYIKMIKSPKEMRSDLKLSGFEFLKHKPSKEKTLFPMDKATNTSFSNSRTSQNQSKNSSAMDYSYRLDDKMRYQQLLQQMSGNDSSVYHTPVGKLFPESFSCSSGKGLKGLFGDKPKDSTKDRIKKVLDDFDNDAVVVDSDCEELISPPSPKPDIKVDPINSLKKVLESHNTSSKTWLTTMEEEHQQRINERKREIETISRCSEETGKINKSINIELLRRKVDDCLRIKEAVIPEIEIQEEVELPELTDEHLNTVRRAWRGDPNECLVKKFSMSLLRRDLMTLSGLNWLNDEVINFYMNMIIERGKSGKWPKSYAFNTFFYPKLIKDGPSSLRRWTKKIDLFAHDIICVPIHLGVHWCMAIIDLRDKSIRYYDSMGSRNNKCLEALRGYLQAEHKDKKGSSLDTSDYELINMDNIPQQMNGSDCGMFSCTFAEFFSRNAKITFSQDDMPYFRKKMVVEIIEGELLIH